MSTHSITLKLNGEEHTREVEARTLLVHFIREDLNLTGTHIGCDTTSCGACTVLMDGRPVKSCTVFAVQAEGAEITTVEGLGDERRPSSDSRRLHAGARSSVRLLHAGDDVDVLGSVEGQPESERGRNPVGHFRKSLPMYRLYEYREGGSVRVFKDSGGRFQ